jgi:hypothetical protein
MSIQLPPLKKLKFSPALKPLQAFPLQSFLTLSLMSQLM